MKTHHATIWSNETGAVDAKRCKLHTPACAPEFPCDEAAVYGARSQVSFVLTQGGGS